MQPRPRLIPATLHFVLLLALLLLPISAPGAEGGSAADGSNRPPVAPPQALASQAAGEELFYFFPRLQVSVETGHRHGGQTPVVFHLRFFDLTFLMDSRGRLSPGEASVRWRGDSRPRLEVEASRLCLGGQRLPCRVISRSAMRIRLAVEEADLVAWLKLNRPARRALLQIGEWRMPLLLVDRPGAAAGAVNLAGPALSGTVSLPLGEAADPVRDSACHRAVAPALFRYPPQRGDGPDRGTR